jgi:hypothetical protein
LAAARARRASAAAPVAVIRVRLIDLHSQRHGIEAAGAEGVTTTSS